MLALTMAFALLCGCGSTAENREQFNSWRANYLAAGGHETEAVVVSSDDALACEYTLSYAQTADGETVEVLAPESVAKVKATVREDGARLEYEGVQLDTGTALSGKLSPLMSLPTLQRFLKDGHLESVWTEKEDGETYKVAELQSGDGARLRLWQRESDMTPVYAEMRSGEKTEIKMNITKFS